MKRPILLLCLFGSLIGLAVVLLAQDETTHAKNRPFEVARMDESVSASAQEIQPTIFFTPKESGMYRISAYVVVKQELAGVYGEFHFSDGTGTQKRISLPQPLYSCSGPSSTDWCQYGQEVVVIFAVGGQPITFQIGPTEGAEYEVHLVAEEL